MPSIRKTLAQRFCQIAKARHSAGSAPASTPASHPISLRRLASLHKRPISRPAVPPDLFALPAADRLLERIRDLNPSRILLEGLLPEAHQPAPADEEKEAAVMVEMEKGISSEDVRKVSRASQMEAARKRLRAAEESCVSYSVFLRICCEAAGGENGAAGGENGAAVARRLDESGAVIVLGNIVFLRPEEVARTIEKAIPLSMSRPDDPRRQELADLETAKAEIDRTATAQVRRELWCGLGYLVAQTAVFMRLTFWELSWDVMEPICFYMTSMYFMAGYAFFLRTSKEPSFQGIFESRFATKQSRLMNAQRFDLGRFDELRRASGQAPAAATSELQKFASIPSCRSVVGDD